MTNEELVRGLVRSSNRRAITESVAAAIVVAVFLLFLGNIPSGSLRFYGCLVILIGTGFICGVVWSFALSYQLLRTHPASDTSFWREAFHSQARLLRYVPLWYLTPLFGGVLLFVAPTTPEEWWPFLILLPLFVVMFALVTHINRRAARSLETQAAALQA